MQELEKKLRENYQKAREGGQGTGKRGDRNRMKEKVKTKKKLRGLT